MWLVVMITLGAAIANVWVKSNRAKAFTGFILMTCCIGMFLISFESSGWINRIIWLIASLYSVIQTYRALSKLGTK